MSRLLKIGDALSQLVNVAFLPNHKDTNANESVSGRAYRKGWAKTVKVIDFVFSFYEKDHCRLSYEADIDRAKKLLEQEN